MQPKLSLYTLLLMLLGFGLTACTVTDEIAAEDLSNRPVNVVATTGMITDIAAIVGGDRVQVTGLMGPGVDPHLYKATESNVAALQNADIIFYNGLHLEAQMTGIFERMNNNDAALPQTFGVSRPDVILVEHLEQASTGQAGQQS